MVSFFICAIELIDNTLTLISRVAIVFLGDKTYGTTKNKKTTTIIRRRIG